MRNFHHMAHIHEAHKTEPLGTGVRTRKKKLLSPAGTPLPAHTALRREALVLETLGGGSVSQPQARHKQNRELARCGR